MINNFSKLKNAIRRLFRSDESRFLIGTAIKVWSISMLVEIIVGYIVFSNMRLNFYFFKAHGYSGIEQLNEAYFEHVLSGIIDSLPQLLGFHVLIFFMGLYIGHLMLRPFRKIGDYCQEVIENQSTPYRVDEFSSYRLLTRFSELFFEHLRESRKNKSLITKDIPPQYQGIHKPVFDGPFVFHFSFFLVIIMIVSIIVIMDFATEIHQNTTQIAIRMLKANPKIISNFFQDQQFLVEEMWFLSAILIIGFHIIMGFHLYSQVSGAAFAIFATMRSHMKGQWQNRVHLVGYSYLRESTRSLNKYLDWIQKNVVTKSNNLESTQ